MVWFWNSWQEYLEGVNPILNRNRGHFNAARRRTTLQAACNMHEAIEGLKKSFYSLQELGFPGKHDARPTENPEVLDEARLLVIDIVSHGEELLLYDCRLAQSNAAYGFLSQHDLIEQWDRYAGTGRLFIEVDQLVADTAELIEGYVAIREADEEFLTGSINFTSEIELDFRTARNLFSVGLDELGVFVAGRGLESVLRHIAKVRRITIVRKNQIEAASEADFFDLIEVMSRIQWKRSGTRLISVQTKALLHYLRTLRNRGAHPALPGRAPLALREMAKLILETANQVWRDVTETRAHFASTSINKTW